MYTVHVLGIDGVWPEYHVFASRAAAERSVVGFEAEGFRAKIYRTASLPIVENANAQGDRDSLSGKAVHGLASELIGIRVSDGGSHDELPDPGATPKSRASKGARVTGEIVGVDPATRMLD
jgi:hypothetical protein